MKSTSDFRVRVEHLVRQIPSGKVMTYGQLAVLCGSPRAARIVGGIAHYGNPALPWHRVVHKHGGCAVGYPGGATVHQQALENENVHFINDRVDMKEHLWKP